MHLGFKACQIQWHLFQVCVISSSWKITAMLQSSLHPILPIHHVSESYAWTFLSKIQKNLHNSKSPCHTKFWHSALWLAYPKSSLCRFSSLLEYFFPVQTDVFFSFCVRGSSGNRHKFHILLILTVKNALKWLEWHVCRVWGVPNPMA